MQISYKQELIRKTFHMVGLIIPVGYFFSDKPLMLSVLIPATLIVTIIDLGKNRYPLLARIYFGLFGAILREHERSKKGLSGSTPMFIASVICILIMPKAIAITAISTLIISDTCAALIGRKWGKHPFIGKSVEGTIAFMISAWAVVAIVGTASEAGFVFVASGIIASPITAVIEVLSGTWKLDDNFTIPLSMGIIMMLFTI
jgi:dolichol kinase